MHKKRLFFLFLTLCTGLMAQKGISGYIQNVDSPQWEPKVVLTKIALKDIPDYTKASFVAAADIDTEGYFSFDGHLISEEDNIYRIHVNSLLKPLDSSRVDEHLFIASRQDIVKFKKTGNPFSAYSTTNIADKEWQKLRKFEMDFYKERRLAEERDGEVNLTSYTKDSLRILLVKLIGIKELANKDLLDTDIASNTDYYIAFLNELKQSELRQEEYFFLEKKLAFLTTDIVEQKYAYSKIINMVLVIVLILLVLFGWFKRRSKQEVSMDLSRQEQNIHALILAGKSNKEIANELFISVSTVKTHITNMYGKLKVSNRKELLQKTTN
ncbi:helix-turn-helix domain-containing protein [Spongiimicrobium salis]|uniref:helix-turn-helix domain-containing protein n=1 Tax=Spongiimicrobium salis TaxID=1667022 RepID=UPI00374CAC3C